MDLPPTKCLHTCPLLSRYRQRAAPSLHSKITDSNPSHPSGRNLGCAVPATIRRTAAARRACQIRSETSHKADANIPSYLNISLQFANSANYSKDEKITLPAKNRFPQNVDLVLGTGRVSRRQTI